ncbi:MAG TPA: hypothetical protein VG456_11115 [Candidatus Sulfopaludibacter sp.]|nr:hypothetical protein [Candidatus Sulfopaludibacter sp.]
MKTFSTYVALCCLAAIPALAQPRFTGFVGAGPTVPLNPTASRTDDVGWNIAAGAGVSNNHLGLMLDFMFNDIGVNSNVLNQVGAPNGVVRTWGFTLDPVIHVTQEGPADIYFTGGGGIYHRTVEFSQPGVAETTFFDPWFGFYPGLVGTNQILASYSQYKGGLDGGVGASFKLGNSRLKAFVEARYHYIFTRPVATTMIPVTIGLRW